MKKASLAYLILIWTGVSLASAQTLDWKPFNSTELGFSMRFPGPPETLPPQVSKDTDGTVLVTTRMFLVKLPDLLCVTGVTNYTLNFNLDTELAADQTNFLKAIGANLVTGRRTEYISGSTRLPELIFTFEIPQTGFIGKAIVVVQEKRVYMAAFEFNKNTPYSTAMETFLDSLELTGTSGN